MIYYSPANHPHHHHYHYYHKYPLFLLLLLHSYCYHHCSKILGCHVDQMCKSLLLENTACTRSDWEDKNNSK